MSFLSSNNYLNTGYGGKNDIAMNMLDYKDFLETLKEDNLSKSMSFKFKKATQVNTFYSFGSIIGTGVVSYLIARWAFSPFYQGIHRNKAVLPLVGIIVYWDFWRRM